MTDTDDTFWQQYNDVLTATELGQILRLKAPSVLLRLRNGTIPAHWIERSWIIFTAEIRAWLPTTLNQPTRPAQSMLIPKPTAQPVDVLADYPDVMDYNDLIRLFGKTKPTIYRWLKAGTIPAYRDGTRWIIHKDQVRSVLLQSLNRA